MAYTLPRWKNIACETKEYVHPMHNVILGQCLEAACEVTDIQDQQAG